MITAWARLSEAKAGLTGKVTIRSASATSWFSSPIRSRPNRMPTVSPAAIRGAASCAPPRAASTTGFAWSCARAVVASTSVQSAIASCERVIEHGVVEDAVGARGHLARLRVRPVLPRLDQPQPAEPEIRHGARRRADVLAHLRLDQDHHRPRLLHPVLGLVGSGARHSVLLGGQMPCRRSPCPSRPLASSGGTVPAYGQPVRYRRSLLTRLLPAECGCYRARRTPVSRIPGWRSPRREQFI